MAGYTRPSAIRARAERARLAEEEAAREAATGDPRHGRYTGQGPGHAFGQMYEQRNGWSTWVGFRNRMILIGIAGLAILVVVCLGGPPSVR